MAIANLIEISDLQDARDEVERLTASFEAYHRLTCLLTRNEAQQNSSAVELAELMFGLDGLADSLRFRGRAISLFLKNHTEH